jgi:polyisoprenoid-binding protein YceI
MLKKIALPFFLSALAVMAQAPTSRPYPIDVDHSTVGFLVPILDGLSKVKGKFTDFAITLISPEIPRLTRLVLAI